MPNHPHLTENQPMIRSAVADALRRLEPKREEMLEALDAASSDG